jgi:hypothetical protein
MDTICWPKESGPPDDKVGEPSALIEYDEIPPACATKR